MTSISSIKTYMYCPRKLYIQENIVQEKIAINPLYNELKTLRTDVNTILNKNIRKIKKEMDLAQIEKILVNNVPGCIENIFDEIVINDTPISDEKISKLYEDTNNQIYYDIQVLCLKTKRTMQLLKKDGGEIADMFFPNSMFSYYMKDNKLDLTGVCDKIEIIDGVYYPISLKNNYPPIKGVWHQDAIEIAAESILIEREFSCDVYVGFVEYQKIGQRRPVVIDTNIRKDIFNIIHDINQIKMLEKAPTVNINDKKCRICEYNEICLEKKV